MKIKINSNDVAKAIRNASALWLDTASEKLVQKIKGYTAVDTGKTRDGWKHVVNSDAGFAVIGNPLENALWEEFGTGEYALSGNGRKNGWVYCDKNGNFHFTYGKQPKRPMMRAYLDSRNEVVMLAENIFKEVMK